MHNSSFSDPIAEVYDLAVVGGEINGTGIAADAAGPGGYWLRYSHRPTWTNISVQVCTDMKLIIYPP